MPWRPFAILVIGVVEVAVGRALHDGLRALELEAGVVALAEGAVALAGEQVADLAEPHVAVHLGVLAARHVEAIARLALLQHLGLERAAARPQLLPVGEGRNRRLAADGGRELPRLLHGRLAHGLGDGLLGDLDAVAGFQRLVDVLEDAGLDAPLLQHGERLLVGHGSLLASELDRRNAAIASIAPYPAEPPIIGAKLQQGART